MSGIRLFLILVLFLSSCSSVEAVQEMPEPESLVVALTPAAFPVRLAVETCAAQTPETKFLMEESLAGMAEADLWIRLGEPDPVFPFMAQIAQEELVLALHPGNLAASLTIEQVADIFSGRMRNWSETGGADAEIQVWALLGADESRQIFDREVLRGGLVTPNAFLAPHPSAMLEAISGNPLAIGYFPKAWGTGGVSTILLGIKVPVLVVAEEEPEGTARELVACLQGELGQSILQPFYSP